MIGAGRKRLSGRSSGGSSYSSQGQRNSFATSWQVMHAATLTCLIVALFVPGGLGSEPSEQKDHSAAPPSRVIRGRVTAIADGDTLYLAAESGNYMVDLAGIDAPEKGQPCGDMAAQVLHLKLFQKEVQVLVLPGATGDLVVRPVTPVPVTPAKPEPKTPQNTFRERLCGVVYREGCVNTQLVAEGMAWHDPRTCPSDALVRAQETARNTRRGLWQQDQEPTPPWQWRTQRSPAAANSSDPAGHAPDVQDLSRFYEAGAPAAVAEAQSAPQPKPPAAADAPLPGAAAPFDYWLTTGSEIRHNRKCRYFGKTKGRPCGPNEGRPCQKCGG